MRRREKSWVEKGWERVKVRRKMKKETRGENAEEEEKDIRR